LARNALLKGDVNALTNLMHFQWEVTRPYETRVTPLLPSVYEPPNFILPLPCTRLKILFTRNSEKLPYGTGATLSSVDARN